MASFLVVVLAFVMVFRKQSLRHVNFGTVICETCCEPLGEKRQATPSGPVGVGGHVCRGARRCGEVRVETVLEEESEVSSSSFFEDEGATGAKEHGRGGSERAMRETRWTEWSVDGGTAGEGASRGGGGVDLAALHRQDVRERMRTSLGGGFDVDFDFEQDSGDHCWNCKRCCLQEDLRLGMARGYEFYLGVYPPQNVRTRAKFSTLRAVDLQGVDAVPLCRECASLVVFGEKSVASNAWPSFIWKMLANTALQREHGALLWGFVPKMWRYWWIDAVRERASMADVFGSVTVDEPRPVFSEVTRSRDELEGSIGRLVMADLREKVDEHLHALVRCPWGCTEFYHKTGHVDLAAVCGRFLGPCLVVWGSNGARSSVSGARDDYLSHLHRVLLNPSWTVMPSIAFVNGVGPVVMTCRDHDGGSAWQYIHPPVSPNGVFPAARSDQATHAVVVPRMIRPMRVNNFSNTFQMNEMRGSYAGIDTMDIVDRGRFDFLSFLSEKRERLSIAGRMDLRGLLARYGREGVIPEWLVKDYLEVARIGGPLVEALGAGSTYISYEDCVRLQRCLEDIDETVIVTDHLPPLEQRQVSLSPAWPREIVHCHRPDKYGGDMLAVPGFGIAKDARCMWYTFSMLVSVPSLWRQTTKSVVGTSEWPGWVLMTAAKLCIPGKRPAGKRNKLFKALAMRDLNKKVVGVEEDGFDVDQLRAALGQIRGIQQLGSGALANATETFDSGCEIVVVTRDEADGEVVLPSGVGDAFELVFVGESTSGGTPGSWTGGFYARHGGRSFPFWWQQGRKDSRPRKHGADLPASLMFSWQAAVFVKISGPRLEEIKTEYLQYIGGQVENNCRLHAVPLIPVGKNQCSEKSCCCRHRVDSEARCSRVPAQQCPVLGCPLVLCNRHSKESTEKTYFDPWPGDVDGEAVEGGDDGGGVIENMEDLLSGRGVDVVPELESHSTTTYSEDGSRLGSVYDNGMHVFDGPEEDDMREAYELGDDDPNIDDFFIPGTNAGRKPVPIWCAKSYISGHVILNNCGTCLIRKNRPLRPSRYQAAFMERMVATTVGSSVPLVYPEAMLFPSIFYKDVPDASLLGAIPSSLLTDDGMCHRHGFAGVREHTRARLKNPSLLCSTDPRYIFHSFDCFSNLNLRGEDSRLVLSRGFVEDQGSGGVTANRSDVYNTDSIDSRPVVNRLAAALEEEQATYFFTQTCNQSAFFGVRRIKQWLDSVEFEAELRKEYGDQLGPDEMKEVLRAAEQAACVSTVRNWMEVSEIFMHYIAKSPEQPVGKVKKIWWRHEYQDSAGNLSHIHCLIWTEDDDEEVIMDRVRGSIGDLIRPHEADELVQEGIFESYDDVFDIREKGRSILFHTYHTDRCLRRVGPGPNDLQCRVPSVAMESPCPANHCRKVIEPRHSEACLDVLKRLGLCEEESTREVFVPADERFRNEKHYPPTMPGHGVMSPTNGRLFAYTCSQNNIQRCTAYYSSRYLAKYVAGIDEGNVVYVHAGTEFPVAKKTPAVDSPRNGQQGETACLVLDSHALNNTKITSSAINTKEVHKKLNDRNYPRGRAMSITEAISLMLGYSQVYTNIDFVNISTVSLDKRPGSEREKPITRIDDSARDRSDISPGVLTSFQARHGRVPPLPLWRQLLPSEQVILMDQLFSPVSVDKTTVFGARPPELRFVTKQGLYFRWFQRSKARRGGDPEATAMFYESHLTDRVETTTWIDGLHFVVKLRPEALGEVAAYVQNAGRRVPREVSALFSRMTAFTQRPPTRGRDSGRWAELRERFFCQATPDGLLPIPVYSNIKPSQPQSFLIHVLLSMGEFVNEFELFSCQDIRHAFSNAGLLDLTDVDGSIVTMLRRYVTEQLVYMPGGTPMFDRLCVEAANIFHHAFVTGDIPINEMPASLYTTLRGDTTERTKAFLESSRKRLAEVTVERIRADPAHSNIPAAELFASATRLDPMPGEIEIAQGTFQSDESYSEQRAAFGVAMGLLDQYVAAGMLMVKCLCIVGGPGCGKTFLMSLELLAAMSRGLTVMTTALMSERALVLGGIHLHRLFSLPVRDAPSVQRMAELALHSIYGNPDLMALLLALDVLYMDELGQLSAGQLSALDIVCRRLRGSNQFMGGILVVATMDPRQLKPIDGIPVMLSPTMLTTFKFVRLEQSVRAGRDPFLQRIQTISRMPPSLITADMVNEFSDLIRTHCVFVPEFDDDRLTSTMLRVFGTHDAVRAAQEHLLQKIKASASVFLEAKCEDYQMSPSSHSGWVLANKTTSNALTKKIKDPEVVYLFPGAVYEMTHNNKDLGFSQSQVAVLAEMPSSEEVAAHGAVQLYIAPVGCKIVPSEVDVVNDPNALESHGWKLCSVGNAPDAVCSLRMGIKAKRLQYAFRQRIASTVHAVMGNDVCKLVTKVSLSDPWYRLWEKEQVVVLLSRTSFARDMIFVGDPTDTIACLVKLIKTRTQYCEYVTHLLDVLCGEVDPSDPMGENVMTIRQKFHPFRAANVGLPEELSGYCYILLSLQDNSTTYIGETKNLLKRLRQHNSGYGSKQTASTALRPWALLGYVCGFEGGRNYMRRFEAEWQQRRDFDAQRGRRLSPCQIADLAMNVMADWRRGGRVALDLRYVQTGTFQLDEEGSPGL